MQPGGPPVERCIAVRASGGSALRLLVSARGGGRPGGRPAHGGRRRPGRVRRATGTRVPASCPSASCGPARWPTSPPRVRPAVDDAPLASGANRVYRFRVELPAGATGAGGANATQDIRWTAELEPDPHREDRGRRRVAEPGGRCAAVVGDFPRRTFVVAGRRVTLLLGPVRLIAADTPLGLRVKSPKGLVRAASYRINGQPLAAGTQWPWSAEIAPATPARPDDDDRRHHPAGPRTPAVGQREPACAAVPDRGARGGRRRASTEHASALRLRPRPAWRDRRASRRRRCRAPRAGRSPCGRTAASERRRCARRPAVGPRARAAPGGGRPARGASLVEIRLDLPRSAWPALARARCARAQLTTRLATALTVTTVRHRLLGRGGGCQAREPPRRRRPRGVHRRLRRRRRGPGRLHRRDRQQRLVLRRRRDLPGALRLDPRRRADRAGRSPDARHQRRLVAHPHRVQLRLAALQLGRASCVSIAAATAATYTPVTADIGSTLRGAVTPTGGPALSTEATQVVKAANAGPAHGRRATPSPQWPPTCHRSPERCRWGRCSPPRPGRGRGPR